MFWYTVESDTMSLRDLRSVQDWFIRYQLNAVPGVAEVASVGGSVQQYQIDVDPNRLRTFNVPLSAVVAAVRDSNLNVGGNVLESNGAWLIVRGVGLIASIDDVKRIVIGASKGVPIAGEEPQAVSVTPSSGRQARVRMPKVLRASRQVLRPLSVSDAMREADRNGDGVVVFLDSETSAVSVVYRRPDGELVLVETQA